MIYCMRFLPKHKTSPEMKLTYAKVSQYILDESEARQESMKQKGKYIMPKSQFWLKFVDLIVLINQIGYNMLILIYIKEQLYELNTHFKFIRFPKGIESTVVCVACGVFAYF